MRSIYRLIELLSKKAHYLMKLTIAAVQLNSVIGQIEANIKKASKIVEFAFSKKNDSHPDLIVLPELAITGYNFRNKKQIEPYLEVKGKGRSYKFGRLLSEEYHCHTLIGYPEKLPLSKPQNNYKIYNSAVLISPTGKVIHNYRKTFLYETDEQWGCEESPKGFEAFDIEIRGRVFKTAIGICMDLNPYKFQAPFEKYEFTNFCYKNDVDLVLVPTAWLNTSWSENWTPDDASKYSSLYKKNIPFEINNNNDHNDIILSPNEASEYKRDVPDKKTARYWILRANPLYTNTHYGKPILFVVCNRSGVEEKMMYAGSSTIARFNGGPSHLDRETGQMFIDFDLFGALGQGTEGTLVRDVEI